MDIRDRKKVLFIDRDGVIVKEDQVDSFEKIIWIKRIFSSLKEIREKTDYYLVLVSNQDGVGTPSFPYSDYIKVQNRIEETLLGEGIYFDDILIDFSLPSDLCKGRKPGVGMLKEYIENKSYDLSSSFVIGDRLTDMELAKNLGAKGILLNEEEKEINEELLNTVVLKASSWSDIVSFLIPEAPRERKFSLKRKTNETDISISINLDGVGDATVDTGLPFFDHMLFQVFKHARFDGSLVVKGDLEVDEHHMVEDTALALGECILSALGDKRGIERYGFFILPMDDVKAEVSLDFSGRPELNWDVKFTRDYVGTFPTELFKHFFRSFANASKSNIFVLSTFGDNHHMAEAIFKAFAKALRKAVKRIPGDTSLPSTKGLL